MSSRCQSRPPKRTPLVLSWIILAMVSSTSSSTSDSVSSSLSKCGVRRLARSTSTTRATKSCWRNCRALTLTDTCTCWQRGSPFHAASCSHAVRKTQCPIGTMSSLSSATLMNAPGATSPARDGASGSGPPRPQFARPGAAVAGSAVQTGCR